MQKALRPMEYFNQCCRCGIAALLGFLALAAMGATAARAEVVVHVHLARQIMEVDVDGLLAASWQVSTARRGYRTPHGRYRPYQLERMHYSRLYDWSPMPYSIFFRGGYAIHGTYALSALGTPASHGCVRLSPEHAKMLYEMVQNEGASISIVSSPARYASR
jgi:lipoprotein-anchoring transpeptidase ErfK/SrfK